MERHRGPQCRRQAADALTAPSRRQDKRLELSSDVIGLAIGEHEGTLPADSRPPSGPARASSRLSGRLRSAADQPLTRNDSVRRCLCFTQAPLRAPGRDGLPSRLTTTPSRPCSRVAASTRSVLPMALAHVGLPAARAATPLGPGPAAPAYRWGVLVAIETLTRRGIPQR